MSIWIVIIAGISSIFGSDYVFKLGKKGGIKSNFPEKEDYLSMVLLLVGLAYALFLSYLACTPVNTRAINMVAGIIFIPLILFVWPYKEGLKDFKKSKSKV